MNFTTITDIVFTSCHRYMAPFHLHSAIDCARQIRVEDNTAHTYIEPTINEERSPPPPAFIVEVNHEEKRVYVTINKTDSYPTYADVFAALQEADTPYWIDENTIKEELAGKSIDETFVGAFAKDGELDIKTDKNWMAAHLTLQPAYGGREISLEDIKEKIEQLGIVFGVHFGTIQGILSEKSYGIQILFAKGKEPLHGQDARIEYDFPLEFKISPKELENDKVDFKELQMIFAVNKEAVLARKIPPTPGEAGCTIGGKPIPAKPGKDLSLTAGRNAIVSNDGLSITSAIDGQPILKGKAVFVEPVLLIQGNVDYSIGNINFKGSVKILGHVLTGFSIKATEDIEINGVVEDGFIEAGRDVTIKGGVLGGGEGSIKAGRDIHMSFVENCYIETGRNILVGDALNSEMSAGDTIDAIMGKGRIMGGKLSARNLITANILGTGATEKTFVSVGFEPKTVAKLKNLKEVLQKIEYTYEEIRKHIHTLEGLKKAGPLPEDKEILSARLVATDEELSHNIEALKGEITMLETTMTKSVQPLVKIRKVCNPNVRIKIGRLVFDSFEEYNSAVFYEEDDKIKVNVYESFT
jgi:uncharacterized protein (DUF342 family)